MGLVAPPGGGQDYTLEGALAHRGHQTIATWVDAFLRGPGNNIPLADGLLLDPRFWIGPEELRLTDLTPKGGPGREFHEEPEGWQHRIDGIVDAIKRGVSLPPLIAEFKYEQLLLADGNHRHGGLTSIGTERYWTIVWCNSAEDFARYTNRR
jgi:hypothetical protein